MGPIEIARDADTFLQETLKTSMESFRTQFEKAGVKDWKLGQPERTTLDCLTMLHGDLTNKLFWIRTSVARNDADGRSYILMLIVPSKARDKVDAQYRRLVASWKWTAR